MSFVRLAYHVVFACHNREMNIIHEKERDVYKILFHLLDDMNCHVHRIGGMPDRIHMLFEMSPTRGLSETVQYLKRESSKIITRNSVLPHWSGWGEGYGAFTVSIQNIDTVRNYIIRQKEHHNKKPFVDEYVEWIIDNGIPVDNPYLRKFISDKKVSFGNP